MATEARAERKIETSTVTTEAQDDILSALKQPFKPRTERAATEVENALEALVAEALADTSLIKNDVLDTIEGMIARLDEKLSSQVNEILHDEKFQALESAWRGLSYLVFNSETDANLKVRVFNISKDEIYKTTQLYKHARWDQSPLFKRIYNEEFNVLGGHPFGSLVADFAFSHSPKDVAILRHLGQVAAVAHAPLFAAAAPELLGMDSWTELSNPRDIGKLFDTPDYAAWRQLRDDENSRYVGLCMPRVLARLPYGAKSEPVEEFAFEEETDGHAGDKYGWMSAAYVMGANVNRAFKDYGWTVRIRGVKSGGEVLNLPTHTFPTDDGGIDLKCPTEIAISDSREAELSRAGLIPIVHRKNTDKAAFIGAQSLYRPKQMSTPEATASDNLSARIPYMFAVSRFAHYLKCMVRDQVGSTKEKEELRRWLQTWITRYVTSDPLNAGEEVKARKPLADAKVTIEEDEENPGFYSARVHLRPHFQLEGMDVGISLVSRIEKK